MPCSQRSSGGWWRARPSSLVLGAATGVVRPWPDRALVVAIFISNVPEAIGSATELFKAGARPSKVVLGWLAVAVTTALAAPLGFLVADRLGGEYLGVVNGFAAGALLVMPASSMVPEAREKVGLPAGVITVLGFALAFALSKSP